MGDSGFNPCDGKWMGDDDNNEEHSEDEMQEFDGNGEEEGDSGDDYDGEDGEEEEEEEESSSSEDDGDEEKKDEDEEGSDEDELALSQSKIKANSKKNSFIKSFLQKRGKDFLLENLQKESAERSSIKSNGSSKKSIRSKADSRALVQSNLTEEFENINMENKKYIYVTYRISGSLANFSEKTQQSQVDGEMIRAEVQSNGVAEGNNKGDFSALNNLIGHRNGKSKKKGHNHGHNHSHHSHHNHGYSSIYANVNNAKAIASTISKNISNKMGDALKKPQQLGLAEEKEPQVIITDVVLDKVKSNYPVGLAFTLEGIQGNLVDHVVDGGHCHFFVSADADNSEKKVLLKKNTEALADSIQFINAHKGYNPEIAKKNLSNIVSQRDYYGVPKDNPIATLIAQERKDLIKSMNTKDKEFRIEKSLVRTTFPILDEIYNEANMGTLSSIKLGVKRAFHSQEFLDKLAKGEKPDPWLDSGEIKEKFSNDNTQESAKLQSRSAEVTIKYGYIPVKVRNLDEEL